MKIGRKILVDFLEKAQMDGIQKIDECILRFENDGLKISANSPAQQARTNAWLKTSAFDKYEQIGNVGVNDLSSLINVLDRFGEKITLEKQGNLLTIKSDGKSVDVELVNEDFLKTDTGEPNLEFHDTFEMTSTRLKEIMKDVKMNKDAVITIKTSDKNVLFTNTGKYKFMNQIASDTCKGGVNVNFGQPFIDSLNRLDSVLQLSVRTDYPCKVIEKTEHSVITIILAPRVEQGE